MTRNRRPASYVRLPAWLAPVVAALAACLSLVAVSADSAGATTTRTHAEGPADTRTEYTVVAAFQLDRALATNAAPSHFSYDDPAILARMSARPGVEVVAPQTPGGDECDSGLLYRGGSTTQEALTPRPGNDTVGWPANGLSTYTVKARACARSTKVQVLSPALLAAVPGLQLSPDPGDPSHIFLQGNTAALHDEWAGSRDSSVSPEHSLTTGVRSSILRTEPC